MRRTESSSLTLHLRQPGLDLPLRCTLVESGISRIEHEQHFSHPIAVCNRLFLFRRGGAQVRTHSAGTFNLRPGRVYLLPLEEGFEVTYRGGSELYYFHCFLTAWTESDVFAKARGVLELLPRGHLFEAVVHSYDHAQHDPLSLTWPAAVFLALCELAQPLAAQLAAGQPSPRHERLLAHIDQHLGPDLSVQDLARRMHTSRSALSKSFQRATGLALKTYLLQRLMQQAKQMLLDEEATVQQIALRLGYKDPYYFHRVFKRHTGHTPLQFRRAGRLRSF